MNRKFTLTSIVAFVAALVFTSCKDAPETLFQGEYDEAEMDAAMAKARMTLDQFRSALESGTGENHAIKVAIHDGDDTEHFWLIDVFPVDEGFKGTLNNEPGLVSNVSFGDEINASGTDISDWMYILDERMHGNYTLRVMLPNMPADERAFYESQLAPLPE